MRTPKKQSAKDYVIKKKFEYFTTNQRFDVIAKLICAGYKKTEIIDYIETEWEAPRNSAYTMFHQAYAYIYQQCELGKEDLRKLNLSRLEEIFDNLTDNKGGVKDKLKTIDLINKTANLYTQDVQISNGEDSFTFDLNLDTNNENKPQ